MDANRFTTGLLIACAALGLGAAMWSALGVSETVANYSDAIAVVDGAPIPRSIYDTALAGLAQAKRNPLTEVEKRTALERIIDEELLLRRALELGLAETDPSSRKALVNAMLQFSIADSAKLQPSEDELRRFYAERPKLVAPQPLLTVKAIWLPATDEERIAQLKAALASGQGFEAAAGKVRAEPLLLPGGAATPAKIAEYAGATVRDTALAMEKSQTLGPMVIAHRAVFVHLVDRTDTPPPPLKDVRDIVVDEWRKRKTEDAFDAYLTSLRVRARIDIAGDAPKAER